MPDSNRFITVRLEVLGLDESMGYRVRTSVRVGSGTDIREGKCPATVTAVGLFILPPLALADRQTLYSN